MTRRDGHRPGRSAEATSHGYDAGTGPVALVAADLSGDGWPDLAVAHENSGDVGILLNDGAWPPATSGLGTPELA